MAMRWTRKMLVLALAAFGVQYLRMVARTVVAELRIERVPRSPTPRLRAVAPRAETVLVPHGTAPTPRRLVISTFEPQGAL